MSDRLKLAIERATEAHKGQVDKAGVDYIQHPLGVLKIVQEQLGGDEDDAIVAVLHDCIEDTKYGFDAIAKDFGRDIALDVLALSRLDRKETYDEHLVKVKKNPRARKVKIADTMHNGLESRLALLPPEEEADKRREEGSKSLTFLLE